MMNEDDVRRIALNLLGAYEQESYGGRPSWRTKRRMFTSWSSCCSSSSVRPAPWGPGAHPHLHPVLDEPARRGGHHRAAVAAHSTSDGQMIC